MLGFNHHPWSWDFMVFTGPPLALRTGLGTWELLNTFMLLNVSPPEKKEIRVRD